MKSLFNALILSVASMGLLFSTAVAQVHDAGWKVRGMPSNESSQSAVRDYTRPYYGQAETREMFSYEPLNIRAGDQVVVTRDRTQLRVLRETLATLPRGERLEVFRVQGPWLATTVEVEGRKLTGWVRHEDVEIPAARPQADR